MSDRSLLVGENVEEKAGLENRGRFIIDPDGVVQGIEASEELTLKKIAAQNKTNPTDGYERIKNIVQN